MSASTPTSPTRRSPRRHPAAANSSAVVCSEDDAAPDSRGPELEVMSRSVKHFCDVDNCPGGTFLPPNVCNVCNAAIHMECFLGTVCKLKEYLDGCHDEVFCSDVCCIWHGNPRINVVDVRKEQDKLLKLL
jgi:hypothetical protein